MASLYGLQLDCNLLAIGNIDPEVDVAKGSGADLSDQSVLSSDHEFRAAAYSGTSHFENGLYRTGGQKLGLN